MNSRVVDFPTAGTLRPAQALAEAAKVAWTEVLVVGLTEGGEFQVINSELAAERALWLCEWGRRRALGLDDDPK
jgi:hypothetical protein